MAAEQLPLALEAAPLAIPTARPQTEWRRTGSVRASLSVYEGGSTGTRRTVGWRAPTTSPNTAVLANLATLRDRSRAATRNDGYAKGAIDALVRNLIGTGIKPLSQAPDGAWRQAVHALWLRWTDEADADGLLDFYGLQTLAVRGWLEGGETFVRLRPRLLEDGLSVPLQLQVLEPELCPHTYDVVRQGSRIRAGIEFSGIGRRVAYWFHAYRPEDESTRSDWSTLRRVPADAVIHLYDPLRAGQLRGVPHLTQALVQLYDLDKYDDATLLRNQLANLFVGFIRRPAVIGDNAELHPLTDEAPTTVNDLPTVALEPGLMQELLPGEEVDFSNPPRPQGYPDFMKQQLFGVSAATGVPYEVLTGDMSGVNDRTVRVVLQEFRRRIQAWQHQVVAHQFCRRVFRAWLERALLAGALPLPTDYATNPSAWAGVKWMPQAWPYLHPVQDVQAQRASVRAGFTTRSAVVAEQGEDAEAIDQEQASDNARADDLGVSYDSDGRRALAGRQPSAASEDSPDDPPPPPSRPAPRRAGQHAQET